MAKRQKQSSSSSIEDLIASLGGSNQAPSGAGPNSALFDPANFAGSRVSTKPVAQLDPNATKSVAPAEPGSILHFSDGLNLNGIGPKPPSLEDLNQIFSSQSPLPSANPTDLVPGKASLGDVKARLAALESNAPVYGPPEAPKEEPMDPIEMQDRFGPKPSNPAAAIPRLPAPAAPPTPAAPLAPAPAAQNPGYMDDIQAIMNERNKIREQQMSLAENQGGDPWIRALVGMGGLGADALSKNYNNNYQNAAVKAYDTPFDQTRALRMKALDGKITDQNPLFELAKAREMARIRASGKGTSLADRMALKAAPGWVDPNKPKPLSVDDKIKIKGSPGWVDPGKATHQKAQRELQNRKILLHLGQQINSDPVIKPSEQNLTSLYKSQKLINDKSIPYTPQMLSDSEQDIANALTIRGMGATEGKLSRIELNQIGIAIANLKQKYGNHLIDLRIEEPKLVEQIQKMGQSLIDDYHESIHKRKNDLADQAEILYGDDPDFHEKVTKMRTLWDTHKGAAAAAPETKTIKGEVWIKQPDGTWETGS